MSDSCNTTDSGPPGSSAHGILQQEHWHGLSFPSPGDLPNPGIEPTSPVLAGRFFTIEPPGSPLLAISSLQLLSCVQLFASHGLQHARLPCPSPTPGACSNSCPSNWWYHPTISSPSPPAFSHQGLFQWVSSLHQVAKLLEFQLQHQSFQWIFKTDLL